jgi:putative tricarboxylic transport membrane protein
MSPHAAAARRAGTAIGLLVLAVAAAMAIGLGHIDGSGGYSGLSPRFLPTLVALGLAGCGIGLIVSAWRGRFGAAQAHPTASASAVQDARHAPPTSLTPPRAGRDLAWMIVGLAAHLALIGQIGFVLASALLMSCVARGWGSRRPGRDALIGLAVALPVWALFAKVMGIGLPLLPALGL